MKSLRRVLGHCAAALAATALYGCPCGNNPNPPVMLSECFEFPAQATKDQCTGTDTEPNNSVLMAQSAKANGCDAASVSGAIGKADIDVFSFSGSLCQTGKPIPPPRLHHDSSGNTQCLFLQCATGATGLASCSGSGYARRLADGLIGCCLDAAGDTDLALSCSNTVGNVNGYVLVAGNGGNCANYNVEYHL